MTGLLSKIGIKNKEEKKKTILSSGKRTVKTSKTEKVKHQGLKGKTGLGNQEKKRTFSKKSPAYKTIFKLIETEKTGQDKKLGKYCFLVGKNSRKKEIIRAVESFYKVKVIKINTLKYKPKRKRRGLVLGMRSGFKKAVITLKEGESL